LISNDLQKEAKQLETLQRTAKRQKNDTEEDFQRPKDSSQRANT